MTCISWNSGLDKCVVEKVSTININTIEIAPRWSVNPNKGGGPKSDAFNESFGRY